MAVPFTSAPDGFLYIGVGENSLPDEAQSLSSPLGKILRIASDGSIPATNPFFGATTGINRAIWAYGLRNPFTFAFEPGSGRMLINDVGLDDWEEINEGMAGANYGWPLTEGPTDDPRLTSPLYAYSHDGGRLCRSSAALFTRCCRRNFPMSMPAITSSPISVPDGSVTSILRPAPRPSTSPPRSAGWWISDSLPTVVSTISNVALARWFESITVAMASRQSTRFLQSTRSAGRPRSAGRRADASSHRTGTSESDGLGGPVRDIQRQSVR